MVSIIREGIMKQKAYGTVLLIGLTVLWESSFAVRFAVALQFFYAIVHGRRQGAT